MDCCFNFDGKYIGTNSCILFWSCQNLMLMLRVKIDCCYNFDGKYNVMSECTVLSSKNMCLDHSSFLNAEGQNGLLLQF